MFQFGNAILGGQSDLIRQAIRSPNFVTGVSGWTINKDGSAEFNNIVIRGGTTEGGTALYYSGTPALGNLVASISGAAGTDPLGNKYLEGSTTYFNSGGPEFAVQEADGQVTWYSWNGSVWVTGSSLDGRGFSSFLQVIADDFRIQAKTILFHGPGSAAGRVIVYPSGDSTGATDVAAINAALFSAAGNVVHLMPGTFWINAPISLPSHAPLMGTASGRSSLLGTFINLASGFSGTAAIVIQSGPTLTTSTDGYLLEGFVLNGQAVPGGTVHGIFANAIAHSVEIRHVEITKFSGDGVHTAISSGVVPYSWRLIDVESSNNAGYGFFTRNMTDTDWLYCRAVFNGLDGFASDPADSPGGNSQWIGCKAEECRNGWSLQGTGSMFAHTLSGCSTQSNDQNGVLIATGGATSGVIQIVGCRFWEDGVNGGAGGGGFAGINCTGTTLGSVGLMVTGTEILTTNVSTPVVPQYGLSLTNLTGHARVSGSLLIGNTTAYNNGGGNTSVVIDTTTGQATGKMSSLTWVVA